MPHWKGTCTPSHQVHWDMYLLYNKTMFIGDFYIVFILSGMSHQYEESSARKERHQPSKMKCVNVMHP